MASLVDISSISLITKNKKICCILCEGPILVPTVKFGPISKKATCIFHKRFQATAHLKKVLQIE